jgi:hypothetical protein
MARPLSPGGKTDVIIAILVPKIIALDIPWSDLKIRKLLILFVKTIEKVLIVKRSSPSRNIFFLPTISPSLPKGRIKTAVVNK